MYTRTIIARHCPLKIMNYCIMQQRRWIRLTFFSFWECPDRMNILEFYKDCSPSFTVIFRNMKNSINYRSSLYEFYLNSIMFVWYNLHCNLDFDLVELLSRWSNLYLVFQIDSLSFKRKHNVGWYLGTLQ